MAVCTLIAWYYAVVIGWILRYVVYAIQGAFNQYYPGIGQDLWNRFISNPIEPVVFTLIGWLIYYLVMIHGTRGVETFCKILMPVLTLSLIVLIVRGLTLPGSMKGLEYFWAPSPERLVQADTWVHAFDQVLWSTTAGYGMYLTYTVLFAEKEGEGVMPENNLNVMTMAFGDTSYAFLAGLAIIPAVAALAPLVGIAPEEAYASGSIGFSFIWLAEMFTKLPFASVWAFVFYLALASAALTSQLGNLYPFVVNLQDLFGWDRRKAVRVATIIGIIASLPSALSVSFLINQDWAWGLALMLSALFLSIAVALKAEEALEFTNRISDIKIGRWWIYLIRYITPIAVVFVLGWWIASSTTVEGWWNPIAEATVGTAVFQWIILLIICIVLGKKISEKYR